jgi:adenylate cyclase
VTSAPTPRADNQRADEVSEFLLGGPIEFTRQDVVDAVGFDRNRSDALWQAMGFPAVEDGQVAFTEKDKRALAVAKELQDSGLVDERLMAILARAMAQSLARLADAHVSAYVDFLGEQLGEQQPDQGSSDAEQAGATDAATAADKDPERAVPQQPGGVDVAPLVDEIEWLLPRLDELVTFVWRRQLASSIEHLLPHAADEEKPLSVGFVDLAGFTKLSRSLSRMQLARLTESFEQTASGVVADRGGRVVKMIGDEIMFYAQDAGTAADISYALIEALAAVEDMPAVHAGVATGPVLLRFGDVYGSTVNIAARLTGIARPDSLLVDKTTADALADDGRFTIKQTRARRVSGYRHLQPFSVRRADGNGDGSGNGAGPRDRDRKK